MNRSRLTVVIVSTLLIGAAAHAADQLTLPPGALRAMRHLAIQHNGRNKPFDSFARETLALITGAPRMGHQEPVESVLSLMAEPEAWQDRSLISVPFKPLREALGMDLKTPHISYNELIATRKLMRMLPAIVQKQEQDEKLTMLENETMDAFGRFVALSGLFEQKLNLVPPPRAPARPSLSPPATALAPGGPGGRASIREWSPILQPQGHSEGQQREIRDSWSGLLTALRGRSPEAIEQAARRLADALHTANPSDDPPAWRLRLEVLYNLAQPFRIAWILYLVACGGLLLSFRTKAAGMATAGLGVLWAGYAIHAAGIAVRVVAGGRPPVSNFYETMLWLPFVALTVALIFERIYRARYFGLAASLVAAITLKLAEVVPLDSSISPVVAVLRSNLWLTVHVLTIVASYGALALATALAHVYGAIYLTGRRQQQTLASLDLLLYRAIQVGVVLLAGGVMLGAVWANASWGRYWGWDPKETWALITLLWYLAILHGRFAGWLRGIGVALSTIGGFFLLLMTYYGVSFYLVGLHSYAGGHAKPLPALLIGYLAVELAFLCIVGVSALGRRQHTNLPSAN